MRATTLAAITAAITLIDSTRDELRERCSESTLAHFNAVQADLQTAHDEEGLTSDAPPAATQSSVDAAAIADELAARGFTAAAVAEAVNERNALEVAAAVGDAFDARAIPLAQPAA